MTLHKELAKITSTFLGIEDHGILTAMLYVDYESGGSQGIGGYALDEPVRDGERFLGRFGTAEGMQFVAALIRKCGARSWEEIAGNMVYVLRESDSSGAKVVGIQPLGFAANEGPQPDPFIFASLWPAESQSDDDL